MSSTDLEPPLRHLGPATDGERGFHSVPSSVGFPGSLLGAVGEPRAGQ